MQNIEDLVYDISDNQKTEDEFVVHWMRYVQAIDYHQHILGRVTYVNGSGFNSIEEAIQSLNIQKTENIEDLKRFIAFDFRLGRGFDYPEWGIVAYQGTTPALKLFLRYKDSLGEIRYHLHPDYKRMVQRYK